MSSRANPVQFWQGPTSDEKPLTLKDITGVLKSRQTKRFRWCIYKKKDTVQHTGIAIFLDDNCFTIDYTTPEGKGKAASQISGVGPVKSSTMYLGYGKTSECMEEEDVVQDFDLTTDTGRSQGLAVLTALGKEDTTPYHVLTSNCRHHVKRCIKRAAAVSRDMKIPFLIQPGDVIAELDKLVFGAGEVL